ncbi:hypothetical protein ACFLX1_00400 [Chloroflexota bacterium]
MEKCVDCGFLCLFNYYYGHYVGADYSYRTKGVQGGILTTGLAREPYCSVHAENLLPEPFVLNGEKIQFTKDEKQNVFKNERGEFVIQEAALAIINQPRDCADNFIRWQQGFTPKEHSEMLDRQWMLDREDLRDKEDKEWREAQEILAQKRHSEQLSLLRGIHKRELIFLGLGVTIAILIITVVGAAIEAEWFSPWFGWFD